VFFCVSLDHFGFVFSNFVLLGLVFSVPSQESGWQDRLRNDLLTVYRVAHKNLAQFSSVHTPLSTSYDLKRYINVIIIIIISGIFVSVYASQTPLYTHTHMKALIFFLQNVLYCLYYMVVS